MTKNHIEPVTAIMEQYPFNEHSQQDIPRSIKQLRRIIKVILGNMSRDTTRIYDKSNVRLKVTKYYYGHNSC